MSLTRVWAPITKTEDLDDGSCLVYGKMTGTDLDRDQQRCDGPWLKTAVSEWFKVGNIREMHQLWAVGKAVEHDVDGDDHYITAKIVDGEAVKKVREGVYNGFSIGIRGPKIRKDASAPGGLIYGGEIIETSLGDVPVNSTCKLMLVKMVGTGAGATLVKTDAIDGPTSDDTIAGNVDDVESDVPAPDPDEVEEVDLLTAAIAAIDALLVGEVAELAAGLGGTTPVQILLNVRSELQWFADCDSFDDAEHMRQAIEAALAGNEDTMKLSTIADLVKVAGAAGATDEDQTAVADLRKALGVDELDTKISTALTKAATAEDLTKVAVRLAKVEETVVATGPIRVRPEADITKTAAATAKLARAAELRKMASTMTDRELSIECTRRADALEAEATI